MARNTPQRRAIRAAFHDVDRPLDVHEVHDAAARACPGLGLATVYRALRDALDQGWLVAVELPGGATRYELAGKHHHHHFACRACQRVFEVEGCPTDLGRLTPDGFKLEDHEVLLYGLCADCRKAEAPAHRK